MLRPWPSLLKNLYVFSIKYATAFRIFYRSYIVKLFLASSSCMNTQSLSTAWHTRLTGNPIWMRKSCIFLNGVSLLEGTTFSLKRRGHFGSTIASQIASPTFWKLSFVLQYASDANHASVVWSLSRFYFKAVTPVSSCLAYVCSFMLIPNNFSESFTSFSTSPCLN